MSTDKHVLVRFPGLRTFDPYDIPWVIVCVETISTEDHDQVLPKEISILTPSETYHYILRIPKSLSQFDKGYEYTTKNKKVRAFSNISLIKFNETLAMHINKARVVLGYENIPLIERIVRRPVISVKSIKEFDDIFPRNLGKCNYHTEHNPSMSCSLSSALGVREWCRTNQGAVAFCKQESLDPLQILLRQLSSDTPEITFYNS